MEYIIIAIIAYLIGSINFSILISKKKAGYDIRQKGSGNAGTTNMLRNLGKKYAAITLICDVLKGVVAIGIAIIVGNILGDTNKALLVQIAGVAVVIGHTFPIFFGFKGGKGVATSLGILLMTNWQLGLICLVFALVLMALTRVVSMGSIAAAILYPVLTLFVGIVSLEGTLSSNVDGITAKTTKAAVSSFIPVVGKILGDAVDTVIGCSSILKNAVGIVGVIIIIGVCVVPIIKLTILMVIYYLGAAVCQPIADQKIIQLLEQMGDTFKTLLAILCSVSVMFVIGVTLVVKISNTGLMYR